MASTTSIKKETAVVDTDVTASHSFAPIMCGGQKQVFLFAKITGTSMDGNIKVQLSSNGVDWADLASSTVTLTNASSQNLYWDFQTGALQARVVATATSGDAWTVEVSGYAKE